jgi:transposase
MKTPKRIELNHEQMKGLKKRIKDRRLTEEDYKVFEAMAETITFLSQQVQQKKGSIARLLRMLFGASTEKLKNITKKKDDDGPSGNTPHSGEGKPKQKGHGKNGASAYTNAQKVFVPNSKVKSGDTCPECKKGKVYESQDPGILVSLRGNPPVGATVYELEKLRCNLCGEIFTADKPKEASDKKYDETVSSIISLLKYGSGVPFNRLDVLQENLGVPLPASTQWDIVAGAAQKISPVYNQLLYHAAQGDIIHNDDTTMKILEMIKTNKGSSKRKGVFTTAILSIKDGIKIALFFTGKRHAGENMESLLKSRCSGLSPPIQMCDALSRNIPKNLETILANCLTHGRRKFVDIIDSFPEQCLHIINILAKVYHNDELTKNQNMSPSERLCFHKEKTAPLMEELKIWLKEQIDQKKAEPNSGLGKAISYMLRHWDPLTLFLRKEGVPIDNNISERAIKLIILNRKNALFFKTVNGAKVGDLFMGIIHTCRLNNVNPFDYLTKIQKHISEVVKAPEKWMPWNYKVMVKTTNP